MAYTYSHPPVRPQRTAGRAGTTPGKLPSKLTIWQVISVWLSVVMALPFVMVLMGFVSAITGAGEVIPPILFFKMAQFTLLIATVFSSVIAICSGLIFLAVQRPRGTQLRVVLGLLGGVATLGLLAFYNMPF